jgi:hypothetical protein
MPKWARLNGRHEARHVLARPKHGLARNSSRPGLHGLIVGSALARARGGPLIFVPGRPGTIIYRARAVLAHRLGAAQARARRVV